LPPPVHPQQALAVYAEPFAIGRRVVVFADPASGLLDRFEALDAAAVVLVSPDDDLDDLRGVRFDLALVADLGLFDDPEDLLARVRRLVGESGVALVAAASADVTTARAFDYYALFDLVAREFADVRMIAQLPFHGVALAEVGEEDEAPAVSVDTQLADGERSPVAFIAIASQRGASLDPYAIIELPAPEREAERASTARVSERIAVDTGALDDARAQLAEERLRSQAIATHAEALQVQAASQAAAQASRVAELERQLAARARDLSELSTEVEEMRSAAEAGRIAAAQVEGLALRADRAEKALAHAEPELARATEAHATELAAFEQTLRDRAQAVRALETELSRREQMVRELVAALEEHAAQPAPARAHEAEAPPPARAPEPPAAAAPSPEPAEALLAALTHENAALREKLDALALELARREGEAQAAAWSVAELERRLAQASAARPPEAPAAPAATQPATADLQHRLAAALDELDALRKALTQEHEARARAESGEELTRARAEIQRQAALLEQLGQKLQTSIQADQPR
jgi:hypothetical protein